MEKSQGHYFTVFTPTYNRSHTLHRVYNSLCSQTYRDFEWLVIDDGSTDDTGDMVGAWSKEADFPIRYFYQENKGKHIAWNKAADLATGEYFICADSDDAFVPEALDRFHDCLNSFDGIGGNDFYGAVAHCKDPNGALIGQDFPAGLLDTDFLDLYYFKYGVRGDKWHCGKSSIHRHIKFDESIKGSLLPESTIWMKIGKHYNVRLLHEPLLTVYSEGDSLCRTFSYKKNAKGVRMRSRLVLNDFIEHYQSAPEFFSQAATAFTRSCFHLRTPILEQKTLLTNQIARRLWTKTLWRAFSLFIYDKFREFYK